MNNESSIKFKLDINKWLGNNLDLTHGKIYIAYKKNDHWEFKDDLNNERSCRNLVGVRSNKPTIYAEKSMKWTILEKPEEMGLEELK